MADLSESEARLIAEGHLVALGRKIGCDLIITSIVEAEKEKYSFFYNSRRWIENGEIGYALAGNLPIVIDMKTGEILSV